jgi:hypothetical protein
MKLSPGRSCIFEWCEMREYDSMAYKPISLEMQDLDFNLLGIFQRFMNSLVRGLKPVDSISGK